MNKGNKVLLAAVLVILVALVAFNWCYIFSCSQEVYGGKVGSIPTKIPYYDESKYGTCLCSSEPRFMGSSGITKNEDIYKAFDYSLPILTCNYRLYYESEDTWAMWDCLLDYSKEESLKGNAIMDRRLDEGLVCYERDSYGRCKIYVSRWVVDE